MKAIWILGVLLMTAGDAGTSTRDAAIDAWMHDYTGAVPGASVLVLHEGEAVIQRS